MPSLKDLKKRIKSVKNISQVTKAMEMVAASKMKRAQENAIKTREFSRRINTILDNLSDKIDASLHPLLMKRESKKIALIAVSPEKGLCGPLVGNFLRGSLLFLKEQEGKEINIITVNKKGKEGFIRSGYKLYADFENLGGSVDLYDVGAIAKLVIDGYKKGKFDEVFISFMDFESVLKQKFRVQKILPFEHVETSTPGVEVGEYKLEPSPDAILKNLIPKYIEMQIYQAILENNASEHSARMVAMKNAKDNAEDIGTSLVGEFNKLRQANITQEIAEIVAAET